ncbi:hypothetical protein HanRHA438_Chr05g0233651 [Helianthus annuus]|nr:hypothetical protein HanRHA438_Chr05g0233651 [Helianthus annuus]
MPFSNSLSIQSSPSFTPSSTRALFMVLFKFLFLSFSLILFTSTTPTELTTLQLELTSTTPTELTTLQLELRSDLTVTGSPSSTTLPPLPVSLV